VDEASRAPAIGGISLGDFPCVVLENRWHQLQIEDRNMEFTGCRLAGLIFGHPEVIEVFDQRLAPTGGTAEAAVDEETDEAEATALRKAEAARRPKPPKTPEPPRPTQPFLIVATEIREDMKAQTAQLPAGEIAKLIGERWRKLGPVKQARYAVATAQPASKRGKGATGRPRKRRTLSSLRVEILDRRRRRAARGRSEQVPLRRSRSRIGIFQIRQVFVRSPTKSRLQRPIMTTDLHQPECPTLHAFGRISTTTES
jgi:hypothetical protein